LLGREREREVLDRVLDGVRAGRGGVLAMHGDAGVGKTALLEYAVGAAREFRIARISGVEAEMELPFAAVQLLCTPFLELRESLPQPQHQALDVAFGLRTGPAPDPFLVGLAVLGLLAEAARQQPLVCAVDDAQWLDSASARTLAFVARRLLAEKIALMFAAREPGETFSGLPELEIAPLELRNARALLESALPARLDERVLERIVAETRGNPLAVLELPRGLSPSQLAGGFGLPTTAPLTAGIEDGYTRRLARLPPDARRLLLVAAADPVGDPALVWQAAKSLGIRESAADAVESEELLALSPRVMFRHPLVRSAVYRSAVPRARREVHRALAEATDPAIDPDRRAWHLAQAAATPDEEIAAELERSAARAQGRGGLAAAAAFLERAVALTPEPASRRRRALVAAETKFQAGALDEALDLLDAAESGAPGDDLLPVRVQLLRAQIALASRRGRDAAPLLLAAARKLEPVDPTLSRATYLEALSAATFAGRLAHGGGLVEISEAAQAMPPPQNPQPCDLLLQGLAARATEGYAAAAPLLKEALNAFQREADLSPNDARWLWFASFIALFTWDDGAWTVLFKRQVELARETGALSALAFILGTGVAVSAFSGDLRTAAALQEELRVATEATGVAADPSASLSLAALRGREAEFSELIRTTIGEAEGRGEGIALTNAEFLSGTLYNGLGRYEAALEAVLPATRFYPEAGPGLWALTELIEAAVRCGEPEHAQRAFERVQETTRPAGTDWALGIKARCHALISGGDDAEALYEEAIERLGRTSLRVQLARSHLVYGEWLRRKRRRLEAREQLRTAYELFRDFGAEGFAERARIELEATGGRARKRTVDTRDQLTPQETQVARLAAQGDTNSEIAARLFISASTVEYHLRKVFRKLDVKSRTQLARHMS
jgi:DNA-binding CsgD family transcriptional regulator